MRTLMATALLCASVGGLACGGGNNPSGGPKPQQSCIILANGNKLCGADAKAYCERFTPPPSDSESRIACIRVGAKLPSPGGDEDADLRARGKRLRGGEPYADAAKAALGRTRTREFDLVDAELDTDGGVRTAEVRVEGGRLREGEFDAICKRIERIDPKVRATIYDDDNQHACKKLITPGQE